MGMSASCGNSQKGSYDVAVMMRELGVDAAVADVEGAPMGSDALLQECESRGE